MGRLGAGAPKRGGSLTHVTFFYLIGEKCPDGSTTIINSNILVHLFLHISLLVFLKVYMPKLSILLNWTPVFFLLA